MRKRSGILSLGVLALLLLPACKGGGGSDAPPPPPVTGGAGFAPSTGPGDTEHYFPNALGDTWYLNVSSSDPADPPAHPFTSMAVTGSYPIFGVQASVLTEGSGATPLQSYYYKSPGGVTFLGTNDPTDLLTAQTVPNPELLFPPRVGPIASFTRTGLNFGEDLDGDGLPEKIDLTQSSAITGFEPVAVPAGVFPSAGKRVTTLNGTLHLSSVPQTATIHAIQTTWAAPGVGALKTTTDTTVSFQGLSESLTLRSEVRGYVIDGIPKGLTLPLPVMTGLAPDDHMMPHPYGRPAVATDGSGFLVLGRRATGTSPTYSVNWRGTLWTLGSTGEGTSFDVTVPIPTTQPSDDVAMDAALGFDGTNYLAVMGMPGDVQHPLVAQRISPAGALLDGPTGFQVVPDTANSPALAFDGTRYLVVYSTSSYVGNYGQIFGVFVTPSGAVSGSPFPIAPAPGYQTHPVVAFDGTNYLVLWAQAAWDTQVHGIQGTRVSPAGVVLDPSGILVESTITAPPQVAFDGTAYLVAWMDPRLQGDSGNCNVFAARISTTGHLLDGTPASSGFPVTTASGVTTFNLTLARAQGECWLAWQEAPGIGLNPSLRGARIKPDGTLVNPSAQGDLWLGPPWDSMYPCLAVHATGGLLVWLVPDSMSTVPSLAGLPIHPFGP
ncbi:MAG TPA: hypothetical protein VJ505_15460 [Holophagaceae bacterium]|nr:hypothetical protein [Holophagaceae bacterium]